jgi:hypothetical protein
MFQDDLFGVASLGSHAVAQPSQPFKVQGNSIELFPLKNTLFI